MADAAPQWRVLETPRFTVVSQISEKETRAWAEEFNQFIDAINRIIRVNENLLPRLTVVIFANEKDFKPFLPAQPNGKKQKLAGFFSRHETWSIIGMRNFEENSATRETIFHEGVHWMLSIHPRFIPLCIQEGLAEVFSTFKLVDSVALWGKPIGGYAALLKDQTRHMVSVDELLHTGTGSAAYNEEKRMGMFYAQSWLFVHYLLFGKHDGTRTALNDFLNAYAKAGTTEEAFNTGFGMSCREMDAKLKNYIVSGKYTMGLVRNNPVKKLAGEFVPASPAIVEMAMAKLSYGSGFKEDALKHAESAVRLAPENAACWDTLACIQAANDIDTGGGVDAAKKAVMLGSSDGWSYLIVAMSKARAAMELGGVPSADARTIANEIEKGLALRPNLKMAYRFLALGFGDVEEFTNEDETFLRQGLKFYPDEAVLFVGLAHIAKKTGEKQKAQELLGRALKDRGKLNPQDSFYVQNLKEQWIFEDICEKVVPLVDTNRFQEALDLLDGFLNDSSISGQLRIELLKRRDPLVVHAKMQKAREAANAGRRDEQRTMLEEIIASPKSSLSLKDEARGLLGGLDVVEKSEQKEKERTAALERSSQAEKEELIQK